VETEGYHNHGAFYYHDYGYSTYDNVLLEYKLIINVTTALLAIGIHKYDK